MTLKLKGKTVLVEIPPCTPLLDPDVAQSRWGAEANELWQRWDTDRDLYALRKLLELRHPPYDLLDTLKGALDEYLDKGVDLAVALAGGGRGRHAQPRTRASERKQVEWVYFAAVVAAAAGWRGFERFRQADNLLEKLGQSVDGYAKGDPQRLSYIRRAYYRRKQQGRPLSKEHKNNWFMMCLQFVPDGPHRERPRLEYDAEAGGIRMFMPEFDERTEKWRETGSSFVFKPGTKKGATLKTAKKCTR